MEYPQFIAGTPGDGFSVAAGALTGENAISISMAATIIMNILIKPVLNLFIAYPPWIDRRVIESIGSLSLRPYDP
jgi:hypothetical protein